MGPQFDWDKSKRDGKVFAMRPWRQKRWGRRNLSRVEHFERNIMRGIFKRKNMRTSNSS